MLSYGRQLIEQDDIDAVVEVLKSDFLTQGPAVSTLEEEICRITGAKYAVAVANGTAALHCAVAALEIEPGHEGITSSITFAASANAMYYCGLTPRFADIEPNTVTISANEIRKRITPSTKLIIPVHFAGHPANMREIQQLAGEHKCFIIEDAAHAIGSIDEDGYPVGSCRYSDLTIFSFHPVKTVTSGEGGAVTTNSKEIYEKLLNLRSHGITKDESRFQESSPGPWYYEMQDLGFNYRLSDIHAALGVSQLKKLERFKARRGEIFQRYNNALSGIEGLTTPSEKDGTSPCWHLYALRVDYDYFGIDRKKLMEDLSSQGVGTQVHYIPVHLQPFYKKMGWSEGDLPISEKYYNETLSLPLYPALTDGDVDRVISTLLKALSID